MAYRFLFLWALMPVALLSQITNYPLFHTQQSLIAPQLDSVGASFHTSVKPYLDKEVKQYAAYVLDKDKVIGNDFIAVYPVADIGSRYNFMPSQNFIGGYMGAGFKVDWNSKLAVSANFVAGNASFPGYIDSSINSKGIVPAMGTAYAAGAGRYSYQCFTGYLSFSPNQVFNLQLGNDRHFLGDGYRSLFLSDVSKPYPFFKISTHIWKLKYVNLYAMFNEPGIPAGSKKEYRKKYGVFHYLSYNITKRFNLSFFESVVWQGSDSLRNRSYEINYLDPVVFYRPVEYSLGSSDNALMGLSAKLKAGKKQVLYGQLILDELLVKEATARLRKKFIKADSALPTGWWANKQGIQLGIKSYDLFRIKGLMFRQEFNAVRPYTYTHGSVQQNYGNFSQPLAHLLGANFIEHLSLLNYNRNYWAIEVKFMHAAYGADTAGSYSFGKDIYRSYTERPYDYGHVMLQGLKTKLDIVQLKGMYLLMPKMNLWAEVGYMYRRESSVMVGNASSFVFAGIKASPWNFYDDF